MAFAAIGVARREFGLRIPRICRWSGSMMCPRPGRDAYDLTTYSQPARALVDEAIRIIDTMIEDPGRRAQRREVRGRLVVRGSARVPATGVVEESGERVWRVSGPAFRSIHRLLIAQLFVLPLSTR